MSKRPIMCAIVAAIFAIAAGAWGADPGHHAGADHAAGHNDAGEHVHGAVPAAYAAMHIPTSAWTDPDILQRGRAIYAERCAVCHGERGDGKGPGAAQLSPKPADLTDAAMVAEMTDSYWLWRVSEGGTVEPFRSKGSAMPAWKGALSLRDRWAVIVYQHTFSGHRGAHVLEQHPEMAATSDRSTGGDASPDTRHHH